MTYYRVVSQNTGTSFGAFADIDDAIDCACELADEGITAGIYDDATDRLVDMYMGDLK